MSKATFAYGRFNPPTEAGHGKLVHAVQSHAEKTGGSHYIFASHTQDSQKNPLSHEDKTHAMKKLFPGANVSGEKHANIINVMKHLQSKGHSHVTMIAGSDRVSNFKKLLNNYNGKEYNFKKIDVKSAGHRDPDAEGAEGMSASKLRGLVKSGKRDEFISHYSDKKLGAHIHDKVKKAMSESINTKALFLFGGPGSGKDYVINNILNRFNVVEVQMDQILNGSVNHLIESNTNLLINAPVDFAKIRLVQTTLGESYDFDYALVSVTNKVSRERNSQRAKPMEESTRIRKWLEAEKIPNIFTEVFSFENSLNLREATEMQLNKFQMQIESFLKFMIESGYRMVEKKQAPKVKSFREQIEGKLKKPHTIENIAKKHGVDITVITKALEAGKKVEMEHTKDNATAETIALAHLWEKPDYYTKLKKVEQVDYLDTRPTIKTKKPAKSKKTPGDMIDARQGGAGGYSIGLTQTEAKVPEPTGDLKKACWKGYTAVGMKMKNGRKVPNCVPVKEEVSLEEAVQYHLENKIPFAENIFRPGSDMFFELIREAKTMYTEGRYAPADEYEQEVLEGDLGEVGIYEGEEVMLDFPFIEEEKKEEKTAKHVRKLSKVEADEEEAVKFSLHKEEESKSDPTKGKGIGKPWKEGGGGAVYVRTGDGGVKKVRFSQSGMAKKYRDPGRLKSFMARHNCLGNKDKTSAAYWACRYPRFFSNSGQLWW